MRISSVVPSEMTSMKKRKMDEAMTMILRDTPMVDEGHCEERMLVKGVRGGLRRMVPRLTLRS